MTRILSELSECARQKHINAALIICHYKVGRPNTPAVWVRPLFPESIGCQENRTHQNGKAAAMTSERSKLPVRAATDTRHGGPDDLPDAVDMPVIKTDDPAARRRQHRAAGGQR
jgi:hypothetical protein